MIKQDDQLSANDRLFGFATCCCAGAEAVPPGGVAISRRAGAQPPRPCPGEVRPTTISFESRVAIPLTTSPVSSHHTGTGEHGVRHTICSSRINKDADDEEMASGAAHHPAHAGTRQRIHPDPLPHSAGTRPVRLRQACSGSITSTAFPRP